MTNYINEGANTYMTNGKTIINELTHETVTREWSYPVRQGVWGGEPETIHFATAAAREAYLADHDYCDKLPRCKVMSDRLTY